MMSGSSDTKITQIRRKSEGRKRPMWIWLERIIANFCMYKCSFQFSLIMNLGNQFWT